VRLRAQITNNVIVVRYSHNSFSIAVVSCISVNCITLVKLISKIMSAYQEITSCSQARSQYEEAKRSREMFRQLTFLDNSTEQ
jgi:hypothetical protein